MGAGALPAGGSANIVEESVEMLLKAPFLVYLMRNKDRRNHVTGILAKEALTYLPVPLAGDVYDALSNLYIGTANKIIREDAKAMILRDYSRKA